MVSEMTQEIQVKPVITGKAIVGGVLLFIGVIVTLSAIVSYADNPVTWLGKSTLGIYIFQGIIGLLFLGGGLHFWQKRND